MYVFSSWVGFNSRWGYIVSIFVLNGGFNNILIRWGCNQDWGFNIADTVSHKRLGITPEGLGNAKFWSFEYPSCGKNNLTDINMYL